MCIFHHQTNQKNQNQIPIKAQIKVKHIGQIHIHIWMGRNIFKNCSKKHLSGSHIPPNYYPEIPVHETEPTISPKSIGKRWHLPIYLPWLQNEIYWPNRIFFPNALLQTFSGFQINNYKSNFVVHLLVKQHPIGPIKEIMGIIYITNKGCLMDNLEKFYIYSETIKKNQIIYKNKVNPNAIFDVINSYNSP